MLELAKPGIDRIRPHMLPGGADGAPEPRILLNSNESVFGPSPNAIAAAKASCDSMERYLEFADDILSPVIADHHGLDPARVTIGQGSDDLLARLARAYLGPGTEMIRSANGYLKAPNYAYANDAEVVNVPDNHFKPSVSGIVAAITDRTRIVYLANPENPAGTYLTGEEVREIHAAIPNNALLVLDCAYEEYVDAPDYEPGHILVGEAENVVMCRTFSKIYGMAGARIGWLYGPDKVIDAMRRIALTFPVSSTAAAAIPAALADQDHVRMVYETNREGRQWLSDELAQRGYSVTPSQTNFILARCNDPRFPAADLDAALRMQGIAIRRLAAPAFADYIRITIGRIDDLKAVIGALDTVTSAVA